MISARSLVITGGLGLRGRVDPGVISVGPSLLLGAGNRGGVGRHMNLLEEPVALTPQRRRRGHGHLLDGGIEHRGVRRVRGHRRQCLIDDEDAGELVGLLVLDEVLGRLEGEVAGFW